MKTLYDPQSLLSQGLKAIREQFQVPTAFPAAVLAEAELAAKRQPTEHADRTAMPFVTLDPASSTDLDQAFTIEASGADLLLHYAIADVAWFVADGGALDTEAWARGTTCYLPDGKAGLYPPVLAEHAASLLPDGPRPAVIFTVRVAPDGAVKLDGAERAMIHSRAKLAYDAVEDNQLPADFAELYRRISAAEDARGAARIDPPEQAVERGADGVFALTLRPKLLSEQRNSAMSLACNLAVADALYAAHTGLFRVMAAPDDRAIARLRHTAKALGLEWADAMPIDPFQRSLNPAQPREAAFLMAIRRAGNGASYAPYQQGVKPWHAAMAASYAHGTAPLRRLADRYVVRAALAVANGQSLPDAVQSAFTRLPKAMATADAHGNQIERAVIDLAEAAMLSGREGEVFDAVITDCGEHGASFQLCQLPIKSRMDLAEVKPGDPVRLRLIKADTTARALQFVAAV